MRQAVQNHGLLYSSIQGFLADVRRGKRDRTCSRVELDRLHDRRRVYDRAGQLFQNSNIKAMVRRTSARWTRL